MCMYKLLFFNTKHHPGVKLVFPSPHIQVSQEKAFAQFQEDCYK